MILFKIPVQRAILVWNQRKSSTYITHGKKVLWEDVETHWVKSGCGLMFTSFSAIVRGSSDSEMKQRPGFVPICNLSNVCGGLSGILKTWAEQISSFGLNE